MQYLFLIIAAYLVGAIPFGMVLTRTRGIDIRKHGSGNIGATNVSRLLGKRLGIATLLLDIGKGFLPMYLAARLLGETPGHTTVIGLCGAAAVVGHMFPIYLDFKGGKGVATALGVFLYLAPASLLLCLVVFAGLVAWTGYVSLGSLLGSAAILPALLLGGQPGWKLQLAALVVALIWFQHRSNIRRLLTGSEQRFNDKAR